MQLLTFTIANRRYGIDTRRIVELFPLVEARPLPRQPAEVLGLIRYRGRFLPAIDLGQVIAGGPCRDRLGTRTLVVRLATATEPADQRLLALVAEQVIGIRSAAEPAASQPPADSPFGPLVELTGGKSGSTESAQLIAVDAILPAAQLQAVLALAGATTSPASAAAAAAPAALP